MYLINQVAGALSYVMSWIGALLTQLFHEYGSLRYLLPLLAVSCAISALMLGFRAVKSFIWGA